MSGIAVSTTINGDDIEFLCQSEETHRIAQGLKCNVRPIANPSAGKTLTGKTVAEIIDEVRGNHPDLSDCEAFAVIGVDAARWLPWKLRRQALMIVLQIGAGKKSVLIRKGIIEARYIRAEIQWIRSGPGE